MGSVARIVKKQEAGFSMVELLMAAFIMGIAILGLSAMQTMVLRTNTGSRNSTTALMVGERVAEAIQDEGRLRLLYARNGQTPPAVNQFFAANTPLTLFFDFQGQRQNIAAADVNTFFTVTITRSDLNTPATSVGGIKNFEITIDFKDVVDPTNVNNIIRRTLVLSRQVAYANA